LVFPAYSLQRIFPREAELASPKARLAFAKQRLATEGDWLFLLPLGTQAPESLPPMLFGASLTRMLFRASLPRASEHHFMAKPALRPRMVFPNHSGRDCALICL